MAKPASSATLGVKVYVFAASPLATRGDAEGTDREAHLAALGGTGAGPISYTDPAELKQKILNLSFDLVDCTVTLNGQVEDGQGCKGSVSVNGKDLPCDDADGWAVTAPNKVELRGAACSALRAAPEANIQASFPCDVIQLR
jgi:hypothetical protein